MTDANEFPIQMAELQRMRVALVILLSQETSKLLSRRQRVAGKEIELMCAERDLSEQPANERSLRALDILQGQDRAAKAELAETEGEIRRMEDVLAKIDADISRLCQA
ncbi:MAG: hypothetical protein V4720_14560 [Pseudomonadota bacterium]|uniref:hypothetical protein n=1 Tax=Tabrizicola sp. TaxID=2005166 RepID=UPI0025D5FCC9|nr:hypothetical protein [Tabrizicola sp.]